MGKSIKNWLFWRWHDIVCWLARHEIQHIEYQRDDWERMAIKWRERCEVIGLERDAYQKRYEYIINLKSEELLMRPPEPFIIQKGTP